MDLPFHTIGHSTRSLDELTELLRGAEVTLLVDIRTVPRSRTNPQFNRDSLPDELLKRDIRYLHSAGLGGLRPKSREVPPELNGFWQNNSFHNFADYALSEEFREALSELTMEGRAQRVAIMCSEAVWWRCHRRIVADWLLAQGETVLHIMEGGRIHPAELTDGARVREDGSVIYPAASAA